MLTCCEEPLNPRCTDRSQVEQKYKTTLDEASDFKMCPPKVTNQCKENYSKRFGEGIANWFLRSSSQTFYQTQLGTGLSLALERQIGQCPISFGGGGRPLARLRYGNLR